ncbi:hypothetical protein J6G99_07855 [bacterium]|nr:hypothetical protein [bacterium]
MEEIKLQKKYSIFIDDLVAQIAPMLPKDVNKLQEDYLINNIKHSAVLLAKSMQTDVVFRKLNFERQLVYIQIMAEWSFHKEIDLFRSGIPAKYWKVVMQKIWYTMWEVMYACIQNDAPDNVVLDIVERYVNRTYSDAVEELKDTNLIDEETEEKAKGQSNIAVMAEEYKRKRQREKIQRIIKYMIIIVVVGMAVSYLILRFQTYGIIAIMICLVLYNILPVRKN